MGHDSYIKMSYTTKGFIILYIAVLLEVIGPKAEKVFSVLIGGLIISLLLNGLFIYTMLLSAAMLLFFVVTVIMYRQVMSDQTAKTHFDATVEKTLDSFSELARII